MVVEEKRVSKRRTDKWGLDPRTIAQRDFGRHVQYGPAIVPQLRDGELRYSRNGVPASLRGDEAVDEAAKARARRLADEMTARILDELDRAA
jgi:hypothetical protein